MNDLYSADEVSGRDEADALVLDGVWLSVELSRLSQVTKGCPDGSGSSEIMAAEGTSNIGNTKNCPTSASKAADPTDFYLTG